MTFVLSIGILHKGIFGSHVTLKKWILNLNITEQQLDVYSTKRKEKENENIKAYSFLLDS